MKEQNIYERRTINKILNFLNNISIKADIKYSIRPEQEMFFEENLQKSISGLKICDELVEDKINIISEVMYFRNVLITIIEQSFNEKDYLIQKLFGDQLAAVRNEYKDIHQYIQHIEREIEPLRSDIDELKIKIDRKPLPEFSQPSGLFPFDTLNPEGGKIGKIAWSKLEIFLSAPCEKGFVSVWKFDEDFKEKGRFINSFSSENHPLTCSAWNPYSLQMLAAGSSRSSVFTWFHLSNPGPIFKGHKGTISSIVWFKDSQYPRIVTAADDNTIRFWNINYTQTEEKKIEIDDSVKCFVFGAYQPGLIVSTGSGKLRFYSNFTNNEWLQYAKHPDLDNACAILSIDYAFFKKDAKANLIEQIIATGDEQGNVKIWDINGGTLINVLDKVHTSPVVSVSFSKDSMLLACRTQDGLTVIWQKNTDNSWRLVWFDYDHGADSRFSNVAFNPSHCDILATMSNSDTIVKIWKVTRNIIANNDSKKMIRTVRRIASRDLEWPSENAQILAEILCERSNYGLENDQMFTKYQLPQLLDLDVDVIDEVIDELVELGLITYVNCASRLWANDCLFWKFDKIVKGWDTVKDSLIIAKTLQDIESDYMSLDQIQRVLSWDLRRINPAATYLVENGHVDKGMDVHSDLMHAYTSIIRTPTTRRFIKGLTKEI